MNTVGQIIKQQRISKDLSIKNIAIELKISTEILLKIEDDKIENDSFIVFNIGHIRSYSNFIGLDSTEIIDKFKKQISYNLSKPLSDISKPSFKNTIFNINIKFSFSLILVILFSFYFLFINQKDDIREYALVPELPENYIPIIEKSDLNKDLDDYNKSKSVINIEKNSLSNSSVLASSKNNINNLEQKLVTLKFINSTWVQLRDKSENIIISKLMDKDEEYSYDMDLEYNITSGNAGNILVIIDNKVKGKIGKFGEIIDSYIIDSNFNN